MLSATTQVVLQRLSNFVEIVFDETTPQDLGKTPRVLKKCQQGCHFYKVTQNFIKINM
jgi:hypothetical protein